MSKKRSINQEKIDIIKEDYEISEIIERYLPLEQRGQNYTALCPFHNDTNIGSFFINDRLGRFKCFSCGAGGDAIDFVQKYQEISFLDALEEISNSVGIVVSDNPAVRKRKQQTRKERRRERKEQEAVLKAESMVKRNYVYNLLLDFLSLDDEHYHYLRNRGLTDQDIEKRRYRTAIHEYREFEELIKAPHENKEFQSFLNYVDDYTGSRKNTIELLKYVPGFFYENGEIQTNILSHATGDGAILIPIFSVDGKIRALQSRIMSEEVKGSRYFWNSTSNLKYGMSTGSPMDIHVPDVVRTTTVMITEGHFKAKVLADYTQSVVVSVQGVSSWREIKEEFYEIYDYFNHKLGYRYPMQNIMIAYDSDFRTNAGVLSELEKLGKHLTKELNLCAYVAVWDEALGKGIDDAIIAGHGNKISSIPFNKWSESITREQRFMISYYEEF